MQRTPLTHVFRALAIVLLMAGSIVAISAYLLAKAPRYPYQDGTLPTDERVQDLLSRMTLEEKIGQMALVDKNSIEQISHVWRYNLGAVLSGAGAKPEDNTRRGWREMVEELQDAALRSRLQIPLLYGIDANHGHGNVPQATIFPHAIGLGASGNEALVERVGAITAREAQALGTPWVYSPNLDLPRDIRWGRVYETYGDDPILTGRLGAAFVRGLQGTSSKTHIAASAKHYVGAGSMVWGSSSNDNYTIDQGLTPADVGALREEYLPPFKAAVDAGVMSIMVALGSWGDTKMAASTYLLQDVLRKELGFEGVIVSDWYGVYDISEDKYVSAVTGINAGIDLVMLPYEYQIFTRDVMRAVEAGDISGSRIDDAVRRILTAKFELGLFDEKEEMGLDIVGSAEHRAVAREAVSQSLVLLQNEGVLPLSHDTRSMRVAGSAADNVGIQSGGWTVEWQGIDGNWLEHGTSILGALYQGAGSTTIEFKRDGRFEGEKADVGIVVVGELPYAEGWGDTPNPELSTEDREAIQNMQVSAESVIVIIISGRPLILPEDSKEWDALIAAWLPGPEGGGVADVLYGKKPFVGKLPLPWPRSLVQLPMRASGKGADGDDPLFPRGFGMSY